MEYCYPIELYSTPPLEPLVESQTLHHKPILLLDYQLIYSMTRLSSPPPQLKRFHYFLNLLQNHSIPSINHLSNPLP